MEIGEMYNRRDVQSKILNEENNIWKIVHGSLTARRKAKHIIVCKRKYEP